MKKFVAAALSHVSRLRISNDKKGTFCSVNLTVGSSARVFAWEPKQHPQSSIVARRDCNQ